MAGKLVVITGPSGVGKGTLLQAFLGAFLAKNPKPATQILTSVSATTRAPRPGETEGKEYFFLSRADFEQRIAQGNFLEWAEYAGNLYGTPRQLVEAAIAEGKIVLLEIELEGARQVAKNYAKAQRIFIAPPSLTILKQRLTQRGTDSAEAIAKRLQRAEIEMAAAGEFDQIIVNDDLEAALRQLTNALLGDSAQSGNSINTSNIAIAAFVAVFLAELGDKTQLTTLILAAQSHSPLTVFLGAAIALITTSFLGVAAGKWLGQVLSPQLLNTLAGLSFLLLSLNLLWEAML